MINLYEIASALMELQDRLVNDPADDTLPDTIEAVEGELEVNLEECCKILRNIEAERDAHKTEAKRHSDRVASLDASMERLKRMMFDTLKAVDKTKVKGELFTVSIQKNGGKVPVKVAPNADTSSLPDRLVIFSEKPNLDAIREELEAGKVIAGFSLGERGESLRIK